MSIRPHFETYRYNTKVCTAEGQTIVECRLAGAEIGTVLSVHAHVCPTATTAADGEIRYEGKLSLHVVYEDADGLVCRAERGAEFSHVVRREEISPACSVSARMDAENITWRREGSGVYVTVVVRAQFDAFKESAIEYLYDGDGLIVNREQKTIVRAERASAAVEQNDEFETDYVGDILMHSERVAVFSATAEVGQVCVEGEICLSILAMKDDGALRCYERIVPFRVQIPADESRRGVAVSAHAYLRTGTLSAQTDEEKGKTKIQFESELCCEAVLYIEEQLPVCVDAYSLCNQLRLSYEEVTAESAVETRAFCERIGGKTSFHEQVDFSTKLLATLLPRVEMTAVKGENGWEAEGALFADVICARGDEGRRLCKISMPFVFPIAAEGEIVSVSGFACGLSVRQRQEGELECECAVKFTVCACSRQTVRYIGGVEEGEAVEVNDCAVSVYLPAAGDGLWETAKKLKVSPEALERSNPELQFPLKEGERIFVYRQKIE